MTELATAIYLHAMYGMHSAWCARHNIAPMPRDYFADSMVRHSRAKGALAEPAPFWSK